MAPAEDFLHQEKTGELFLEQQGEYLAGEDFPDVLVIETKVMVKSAIR